MENVYQAAKKCTRMAKDIAEDIRFSNPSEIRIQIGEVMSEYEKILEILDDDGQERKSSTRIKWVSSESQKMVGSPSDGRQTHREKVKRVDDGGEEQKQIKRFKWVSSESEKLVGDGRKTHRETGDDGHQEPKRIKFYSSKSNIGKIQETQNLVDSTSDKEKGKQVDNGQGKMTSSTWHVGSASDLVIDQRVYGPGVEPPDNDGYRWEYDSHSETRAMLRVIYRCDEKSGSGCAATKHVETQKTSNKSAVINTRQHTCRPQAAVFQPTSSEEDVAKTLTTLLKEGL